MRNTNVGRALGVLGIGMLMAASAHSQVSQTWNQRLDGPDHQSDHGYLCKMDSSGNIFVSGPSFNLASGYDMLTAKYSPTGTLLWQRTYNGPGNGEDQSWTMAIDNQGNALVGGWSYGGATGRDYAVVKYSPTGTQLWSRRFDGGYGGYEDIGYALVVDANRNVTMTGYSYSPTSSYDVYTIQYDQSGNIRWQDRWAGPSTSYEGGYSSAIDSNGNIAITGDVGVTESNTLVLKYSSNGVLLWSAEHHVADKGNFPYICTMDSSGGVAVSGVIDGDAGAPYDILTLKYDPAGSLLWSRAYDGPGGAFDYGWAIATDAVGNVFSGGPSHSTRGDYDGTIIKYDAQGNQMWVRTFTSSSWVGDDTPGEFQTDDAGNLYVSGTIFTGRGQGEDYILQKYDPAGTLLWTQNYDSPTHGADWGYGIARDKLGHISVVGESSSVNYSDFLTVLFSETTVQIVPTAFNVVAGSHISGDLPSIFISDELCAGFFPDESSLSAIVELSGTTAVLNPSSLAFQIETRVDRTGLSQSIALYNYDTSAWVTMDGRTAATADQMVEVSANGNPGAFVGPGGQVGARVTWQPINDEDPSQDGWLHCIDVAKWIIGV